MRKSRIVYLLIAVDVIAAIAGVILYTVFNIDLIIVWLLIGSLIGAVSVVVLVLVGYGIHK